MDILTSWLGREGYMPHGYCFTWSPGVLWSMVAGDAVIAASYYSIPLAMLHFASRRKDVSFKWLVFLFSAFIFACGTTHLMAIWTIWKPDYGAEALLKLFTAAISAGTAIVLWPLIPKALRVPTVVQLQLVVDKLEQEIARRRAAQEQLAVSEESLEATLASIGAGFIATDTHGHVTHINPLAQRLTGWGGGDAIGRHVTEVFTYEASPGEGPGEAALSIEGLLSTGERPHTAQPARLRSREGKDTPIEASASVLRGQEGAVRGKVIVFRDMTDELRAREQARLHNELMLREVQLQAENRQYQEASRLKSEFLANMSHELRTPLNAIIGFAELLHSGRVPMDSPKVKDFLSNIHTSGRHLLRLINDLLDLSKVEAGKFEFHPMELHADAVVGEVTDILQDAASRKGLEVHGFVDPQVQRLTLDPARLKQVLYNYVSNAIKFTPPGGRIDIRVLPEDASHVRLEVVDTGIGIAAEDLPRLFSEFTQLSPGVNKTHQGTGLGLALTKRLVEAQGGRVGVQSQLHKGSVFFVVLPRDAGAAGSWRHEVPAYPDRDEGAPAVLVVEDDAQDQRRLGDALHHAGYRVVVAASGEQAVAQVMATRFDAITLDLILPDMPGLQLLEAIRGRGLNQATPVVLVSMVAEQPAVLAARQVSKVLVKPLDAASVLQALRELDVRPPTGSVPL